MCPYGVGCLEEKSGEKAVVQVTCFLAEKKKTRTEGGKIFQDLTSGKRCARYTTSSILIYFIRPRKTISEPHK